MNSPLSRIVSLVALLLVAACAATDGGNAGVPAGAETCGQPRPEVCTREYRPVCAALDGGGEATYSNGCTACADSKVVSHRPGACGQ